MDRNPLFDAARKGPLFMRPAGDGTEAWGGPWKLLPPDWIMGPVGLLLVKDIDLPAGAPGVIDGFSFMARDKPVGPRWFMSIAPLIVTGHTGMRLSRFLSLPEFLPPARPEFLPPARDA